MSDVTYYTVLDVAAIFRTESDVCFFIEHMIDRLEFATRKGDDYIPPIVYSSPGKVFNIDYNFLVDSLADFVREDAIIGDFELAENAPPHAVKNGLFLVVGIFENYYGVARVNNKKIDLSRYKSRGVIEMTDRFYNILVIQNGENIKRFSAVPFSESAVKKIIQPQKFQSLENITKKDKLKQIVFGLGRYREYIEAIGCVPDFVKL